MRAIVLSLVLLLLAGPANAAQIYGIPDSPTDFRIAGSKRVTGPVWRTWPQRLRNHFYSSRLDFIDEGIWFSPNRWQFIDLSDLVPPEATAVGVFFHFRQSSPLGSVCTQRLYSSRVPNDDLIDGPRPGHVAKFHNPGKDSEQAFWVQSLDDGGFWLYWQLVGDCYFGTVGFLNYWLE